MLKNFELNFAPTSFHAQSRAWRTVILLNLVRSATFILNLHSLSPPNSTGSDFQRLKRRLGPLSQVEDILSRRLAVEPPTMASDVEREQYRRSRASEISVRSGRSWMSESNSTKMEEEVGEALRVLSHCREDLELMWSLELVQTALQDEEVVLQDQAGL